MDCARHTHITEMQREPSAHLSFTRPLKSLKVSEMRHGTRKIPFKRQKLLLALLQTFGGRVPSLKFQKLLFLFVQKYQTYRSYDFVPYKYGCFSFQSYADRRRLISLGAILNGDGWVLASDDDFVSSIEPVESANLALFAQEYSNVRGNDLIREVYSDYPYYATKSKIASKFMTKTEIEKIRQCRAADASSVLFTIGYEGNSFENYLNRLIQNNVAVLCDVRRNPLSRKYGFSKSTLSDTLARLDIVYIHMPDLGIVSEKRRGLETASDYRRLLDDYEATTLRENADALAALQQLVRESRRVAITCFEADHCMCHRGRIAKKLERYPGRDYEIAHI